jgi:asparagine synthetase B (glutamine-hydrolysing)
MCGVAWIHQTQHVLYSSGIINHSDGTEEQYHSKARVLLSGLGADEQLGGYSRHREAYRQGGWHQMIKEVGRT